MFTGIIEGTGKVVGLEKKDKNLVITVKSDLASELKIDQSIAHNGVCLTVVSCDDLKYNVVAIDETLKKSNLDALQLDSNVNLERAMKLGDRLDGHMVQGHVDTVAVCKNISEDGGSWIFTFKYKNDQQFVTVEKGSITVNGVSLTVVNSKDGEFSVAIIPYTYEQTNFKDLSVGDSVNLEFDILGKYIQRLFDSRN